jgi:hypothetical protein
MLNNRKHGKLRVLLNINVFFVISCDLFMPCSQIKAKDRTVPGWQQVDTNMPSA